MKLVGIELMVPNKAYTPVHRLIFENKGFK